MSWSGESRAIKEALKKEEKINKELCKSCGKKRGVVRCASVTYKSVIMLCYGCAIDLLSTYPNDEKNGLTPADRIYELLCFDNTPTPNLRSKEVCEQPNLFEAQP